MKDFSGRTAFITGGANGIGLGLARALLAEGCKVAIADIREDSISAALKTLDNSEVMGVPLDVASRDGFAAAADEVEARLGPVSLVFNNAGINLFQTIDELLVRRLGLADGRQSQRRHQRGDDVRAEDEGEWSRRPCRQHSVDGRFPVRAPARHLQHHQVRGARAERIAPLQPRTARHRRFGPLPRPCEEPHHAAADIRPEDLKAGAKPVDAEMTARIAQVHQSGMEPDVVAARVLDAIRANRFYIFSHPEFRDELRELFDEIIAEFRDYPEDEGYAQRLGFEKGRREGYKAARAAARGEGLSAPTASVSGADADAHRGKPAGQRLRLLHGYDCLAHWTKRKAALGKAVREHLDHADMPGRECFRFGDDATIIDAVGKRSPARAIGEREIDGDDQHLLPPNLVRVDPDPRRERQVGNADDRRHPLSPHPRASPRARCWRAGTRSSSGRRRPGPA